MQKMWRDLGEQRSRGLLVVLAIALGIAGFTAVLASYAILTRELDAGYLASSPASAIFYTDAVDDALLASIEAQGGVSHAEARRKIAGRIRSGLAQRNLQWRNLQLFVVKDYGQIALGKITRQEGTWPPAAGEILIERDAFQVLKGNIGDQVLVKTASGNERELRVVGSVHDVGQAQARMENIVYGYITLDTLALLGEEPYLDQIQILVAENAFDEQHVRAVARKVEAFLAESGHPARRVEVPKPGRHPHADLMGMLLLAKAAFGIFVLALSSILVINLLSALMAAQIRQVALMKTLGGSRRQIAAIYFGQVLLLSLAALALGLPTGIWGSHLLCRYQAAFLNFDLESLAIPAWVYLLVALVGISIPLLAAAWPVYKGCSVPVLRALSNYGTSSNTFGIGRFDRLLAGLSGPARPILLAVRNGFRRRSRLFLTLLTLTFAGLFFLTGLNVRASLIQTLDHLFASKKYDLTIALSERVECGRVEEALRSAPLILATECGLDDQLQPGTANRLQLRLASSEANAIEALKIELDQRLEAAGLRALAMTSKADSRFSFDQHMVMIYMFLIIVSAILGSVGALGLATTMSLNVRERRREIGILRAIGASPAAIRWIFVAEGSSIGLMSWLLAALISWPFSHLIGDLLARRLFRGGLDFTVAAQGYMIWLGVSLLVGALASLLPAWRASRGDLREALTYE